MSETVTIEAIGHRGDGIAHVDGAPLYVPFTLPGERVSVVREGERGRLVDVLDPSPERIAPACRHFGTCGNCALQMMPLDAERRLKRDIVFAALAEAGLSAEVEPTRGVGPRSRRRTTMTAARAGQRIVLGYNERHSNRVFDVEECPVVVPAIEKRLPALRALLAPLLADKRVRVTLLATLHGLDVTLDGGRAPRAQALASFAAAAQKAGVAQLSIGDEPVLTLAEPAVTLSGVTVAPPAGAFLQASAEAEAIMAGLVVEHLAGTKRAADLFAGFGTFALALSERTPAHAVEASAPSLAAMQAGLRLVSGRKPVTAERRDLFIHPLSREELNRFDAVAIDPPRAGAPAQSQALAASKVKRIASVSCNPASFARDARTLVDGGYRLERVVPVDQFVWSAEVEVVGLFSR